MVITALHTNNVVVRRKHDFEIILKPLGDKPSSIVVIISVCIQVGGHAKKKQAKFDDKDLDS